MKRIEIKIDETTLDSIVDIQILIQEAFLMEYPPTLDQTIQIMSLIQKSDISKFKKEYKKIF